MSKTITVYTSTNCSSCGMVKRYLDMKGENYSEINIEQDAERERELVAMTGARRVPVTVVEKADGAKDISVGYNLASLSSALG